MHRSGSGTVTSLLRQWSGGKPEVAEKLLPLVYGELRKIAGARFYGESVGHTLQPTALIHEAYLRLAGQGAIDWQDRSHFLGFAARVMRQVLVDHARERSATKRGGALQRIPLEGLDLLPALPPAEIVAVDDALRGLARVDPQKAKIVELRFFGGLTLVETAEALEVSLSTVNRDWRMARAWLFDQLSPVEVAGCAGPSHG